MNSTENQDSSDDNLHNSPASAVDSAVDNGTFVAPHPGASEMPRWNSAELIDAPKFQARNYRNWLLLLGPGLVMGALFQDAEMAARAARISLACPEYQSIQRGC